MNLYRLLIFTNLVRTYRNLLHTLRLFDTQEYSKLYLMLSTGSTILCMVQYTVG